MHASSLHKERFLAAQPAMNIELQDGVCRSIVSERSALFLITLPEVWQPAATFIVESHR